MEKEEFNIRQMVRDSLPEWKHLNDGQIVLQRMTGITNETYKVQAEGQQPIIFRKFGQSTENVFLERQAEAFVYSFISSTGLGPKIFFANDNIRLEEFIPSTVLQAADMLKPEPLKSVALTLRQFHELKPIGHGIHQVSMIKRVFVDEGETILKACRSKMDRPIYSQQQQQILSVLRKWISEEQIKFISEVCGKLEKSGLVFSHNDLLANNVLIKQPSGEYVFIDYEYASYNYAIFDIANYFNQSTINYDVSEEPYFGILPPPAQALKRQFLEAYTIAKKGQEEFNSNYETHLESAEVKEEVELLEKQLALGELLSHLLWGWWGVLVCKNPLIQFDYLAFAKYRHDQYMLIKASL